jgi:hypothetical protein
MQQAGLGIGSPLDPGPAFSWSTVMSEPGMPLPLRATEPRIIKPTVCRIVEYVSIGEAFLVTRDQPLAAIVTYVWNDRLVNLAVFDADGEQVPRIKVLLQQPDDPPPGALFSYCRWMTYQPRSKT